jgi:aspartate/methionine/tyrosine aminotransferase
MPDSRSPPSAAARSAVRALVASQIREVANEGMDDPDILPFWFGEPDEVTPAFIRDAGAASLARGETFYTQNFGIPKLRGAIAAYVSNLHRATADANIAVTASGMSALMLAVEALVAPGDRVRGDTVVARTWSRSRKFSPPSRVRARSRLPPVRGRSISIDWWRR